MIERQFEHTISKLQTQLYRPDIFISILLSFTDEKTKAQWQTKVVGEGVRGNSWLCGKEYLITNIV